MISKISRAGVLVPEFSAFFEKPEEHGIDYAYERIGRKSLVKNRETNQNTLSKYLSDFANKDSSNPSYVKQLRALLSSTARSMGTIHRLKILHGHPHFNNFIPVKSRVGVIDFYLAREVNVNWSNPQSIVYEFRPDYAYLTSNFERIGQRCKPERLKVFDSLRTYFFRKLVERYPTSDENKRKVLRTLLDWSKP